MNTNNRFYKINVLLRLSGRVMLQGVLNVCVTSEDSSLPGCQQLRLVILRSRYEAQDLYLREGRLINVAA